MDNEMPPTHPQTAYLLKVIGGLLLLASLIGAALWLPLSAATPMHQQGWLGLLLLLAIAIVPAVGIIYRRMDELQKTLHMRASMATLTLLASVACVIGILQAYGALPLFNQFWSLGLLLALWGINLMLADRHYR